jgi:membrane protease YdiL (CAAX protease family)
MPKGWMEWQRVRFAADYLSPAAALAELQRAKHAGVTADPWLEARIYLHAGKTAEAAHVLACGCQGGGYETVDHYQTRLMLALATGDRKATSAALQGWLAKTGLSWSLLSAYGNALRHDPLQLFSPSLASLALALLGAMLAALCLPGVVAFPAHYRGTVRARLSKPSTALFEHIGLRHMWIACAAYLVTTTAIPMFWGEGALHAWLTNKFLWPEDQIAIVMIQAMMAVAVSVLMLPAIARFTAREWLGDRGLKLALATIVIWTLAKVFLLWVAAHTGHLSQATQATQHDRLITTLIQAATHVGGAPLAMFIVAVLAPIYEELIFRGCVLGGLSRHISFGWANVWQGTLFALIHNDMRHFVFYFLMGVLSGWLVRRTRGLAASIGLHMANNAVACAAVLLMHP